MLSLPPDSKYLITFSGGQDSTNLIILWMNISRFRKSVCLCCNHLWKKQDFYLFRHSLQISFILHKPFLYTLFFSKIYGEQNSRKNRYKSFLRIADYSSCDFIVTAHTRNDQIETFFINLFRGSGKFGLQGFRNHQFLFYYEWASSFFY